MRDIIQALQHYKTVLLLLAGLCGSFIGLGMHPKIKGFSKRFSFVFSGVCCTVFLSHTIASKLGMLGFQEMLAVGFVVAIFWSSVLEWIKGKFFTKS